MRQVGGVVMDAFLSCFRADGCMDKKGQGSVKFVPRRPEVRAVNSLSVFTISSEGGSVMRMLFALLSIGLTSLLFLLSTSGLSHSKHPRKNWRTPTMYLMVSVICLLTLGGFLSYGAQNETVKMEHAGYVSSVVFTPDGTSLASCGADKMVRCWDVSSGKVLFSLEQGGSPRHLAFNPQGTMFAVAIVGAEPRVRLMLWDVRKRKELGRFEVKGSVQSLIFSPDGKAIATAEAVSTVLGPDGGVSKEGADVVTLRDIVTGETLIQFQGHKDKVLSVAFSRDGKHLVSGSADMTAKVWSVDSGKEICSFNGHRAGGVPLRLPVAFSPNGKMIASGGSDSAVRLWEAKTGKELVCLKGPAQPFLTSVAFSPDGTLLASNGRNGVCLWNVATGKELTTINGNGSVGSIVFSPNGRWLAASIGGGIFDRTGEVKLWDVANETGLGFIPTIKWEHINSIYGAGSRNTNLQKEEVWKRFRGKRIRWAGTVTDVTTTIGGDLCLCVKMNDTTLTFDLSVVLNSDQKERSLTLRKGDKVNFTGLLNTWGSILPMTIIKGTIID